MVRNYYLLVFILNFLDQIQTGKNAYRLFTKGIEALSHMDAGIDP